MWKKLLCPFRTLGVTTADYDARLLKKSYRSWLVKHHPDKVHKNEKDQDQKEDEFFLQAYSNVLKDLPVECNGVWEVIVLIEQAIVKIEFADTEEKLREVRRAIFPYFEFEYIDEDDFPHGYKKAIGECLVFLHMKICSLGTTFCKKHHGPREFVLETDCIPCKIDRGLLTVCHKHSTLLKRTFIETCEKCAKSWENFFDSDEELPDLNNLFQSDDGKNSEDTAEHSEDNDASTHTSGENEYAHVSILRQDEDLQLFEGTEDVNFWKCILCKETDRVKTNQKSRHSTIHKKGIFTKDFKVLLCKKECRNKSHYHCPYCGKLLNRKIDARCHFEKCAGNRKRGAEEIQKSMTEQSVSSDEQFTFGEFKDLDSDDTDPDYDIEIEKGKGKDEDSETIYSSDDTDPNCDINTEKGDDKDPDYGMDTEKGDKDRDYGMDTEKGDDNDPDYGMDTEQVKDPDSVSLNDDKDHPDCGVETEKDGDFSVDNEGKESMSGENLVTDDVNDADFTVDNEGKESMSGENLVTDDDDKETQDREKKKRKAFKKYSGGKNDQSSDSDSVRDHKKHKMDDQDFLTDLSEDTMESIKLHESIINANTDFPNLVTRKPKDNHFNCKLCPTNAVIPLNKVKGHKNLHLDHFIEHGNKHILLCKQKCRHQSHFHCPVCGKTTIRKTDAKKHIQKCQIETKLPKSKMKKTKRKMPFSGLYTTRKAKQEGKRVNCPECNLDVYSWNLMIHIRNKHTEKPELVTEKSFLESVCVDRMQGIYLVHSGTSGPNAPLHVQKKVQYGTNSHINCENGDCKELNKNSRKTKRPDYECKHVQSIAYNKKDAVQVTLHEHPLLSKILKKTTIKEIKERKSTAKANKTPFVCITEFESDSRRIHLSVYDRDESHAYSKMGRFRVTYDTDKNTWVCVCCQDRSCVHKYISKWACLMHQPEIFAAPKDPHFSKYADEDLPAPADTPNFTQNVREIAEYQQKYKTIPVDIPARVLERSRRHDFPRELHPTETECVNCQSELAEELITVKASIVTKCGSVSNVKTFQKYCLGCNMRFNYQEFREGVHNFNNRLILSLELCVHLRAMVSTHTAVSRVIQSIEKEYDQSIPYSRDILDAYLHYESLTEHPYDFYCTICGIYPVKVCGDGNKKTVYTVSVEDLPLIPDDFDDKVNCESFWSDVGCEILSKAFMKDLPEMQVKPSLHHWAGWIGKQVRKTEYLLNTEFLKVRAESQVHHGGGSTDEVTDEYLQDLLLLKPEKDVKKLCKEMGLSAEGSKVDMILRLRRQAKVPDLYKKILTKIKGHCGGWVALVCEHGCTYAVKFVVRAESVRDYSDLLLGFQHFPNIVCGDLAPRLARHTNLRCPEILPFHPNEGSFLEATDENIKNVKYGKISISLPWLNEPKHPMDENGHPLTGSDEHYSCLDRFHEGNWKGDENKVRRVTIVKELSGQFNTQACEQLNAEMGKNNYFLNMMKPSTQIFIFRLLLELRNVKKNKEIEQKMKKTFPTEKLSYDKFGRLLYGEQLVLSDVLTSETESASDIEYQASKVEEKIHLYSETSSDLECFFSDTKDSGTEPYMDMDDQSQTGKKDAHAPQSGENLQNGKEKTKESESIPTAESSRERQNEDADTEEPQSGEHLQKGKEKTKESESTPTAESSRESQNEDADTEAPKSGEHLQKGKEKTKESESTPTAGSSREERSKEDTKSKVDAKRKSTQKHKDMCDQEHIFNSHMAGLQWHHYSKVSKLRMPDVPPHLRERISNFTSVIDSKEVLQFHAYAVKRSSLCTLKCSEWLDDQVVNAYINLIVHEYNMVHSTWKALHIDSFLMTSLAGGRGYSSLKNIYLSEYRYVIIPVHCQNHWCLMVIYMDTKEIAYIDPLNPGIITPQGINFMKKIKSFSINRLAYKPADCSLKDFKVITVPHNQQEDGASCGIWVLMFAEQLLWGHITPKQCHVPYFRWYVAYKLYTMGKRKSEDDRSICDIQCKIKDSKLENITWLQCDSPMCARWVHTYCVDLPASFKGDYFCPICAENKLT